MLSFVAVDVVVVFAVVGLFSGCCSGGCFDVFTVLVVVVGLMAVVPYVGSTSTKDENFASKLSYTFLCKTSKTFLVPW